MGCTPSAGSDKHRRTWPQAAALRNLVTVHQVKSASRAAGFASADLIIGVDFALSNRPEAIQNDPSGSTQRQNTECIIDVASRVLAPNGKLHHPSISSFGFGDVSTHHSACFHFCGGAALDGDEVLQRYQALQELESIGGATGFTPVIRQAIKLAASRARHQVLLIITDSEIQNDRGQTANAIVDSSQYPISIVLVGVGEGSWGSMQRYVEDLPERSFDNFHFVSYCEVLRSLSKGRGSKYLNPKATALPGNMTCADAGMMKVTAETTEQTLHAQLALAIVHCLPADARCIAEAGLLDSSNYPQADTPGLTQMVPEQLAPTAQAPKTPESAPPTQITSIQSIQSCAGSTTMLQKVFSPRSVGADVEGSTVQLQQCLTPSSLTNLQKSSSAPTVIRSVPNVGSFMFDSMTPRNLGKRHGSYTSGLNASRHELNATDLEDPDPQGRSPVIHAW